MYNRRSQKTPTTDPCTCYNNRPNLIILLLACSNNRMIALALVHKAARTKQPDTVSNEQFTSGYEAVIMHLYKFHGRGDSVIFVLLINPESISRLELPGRIRLFCTLNIPLCHSMGSVIQWKGVEKNAHRLFKIPFRSFVEYWRARVVQ